MPYVKLKKPWVGSDGNKLWYQMKCDKCGKMEQHYSPSAMTPKGMSETCWECTMKMERKGEVTVII